MKIIIVEKIDGESLESYVQAFFDVNAAEKAFSDILINDFKVTDRRDIEDYLDDGYFADDTHFSVIIKEIEVQ